MTTDHNQLELHETTFGNEFLNDQQPILGQDMEINTGLSKSSNRLETRNNRGVEVIPNDLILKQMNNINDITANLGPIIEYAQEPLVSLTEACAPLITTIDNLSVYVQQALKETPNPPPDK
ncbi:unnamed protein product, partial [Adineta steineri]